MTAIPETPKPAFTPEDPAYDTRVSKSFAMQTVMQTLGIRLVHVAPGQVELEMPYDRSLTQQHGFIHGGITTTALDSACAYAAFSLMPANAAVLTVELKTTLLAPAKGSRFRFQGTVVKSGRTLSFTEGRAWAIRDDRKTMTASMTATIMAVHDRPDLKL